jgi:uncharacterized protein (DUF1810 family)
VNDRFDLERFVIAQNAGDTYQRALEELRRGRKTTHWMWFVFPQLSGLGQRGMSRRFAISSLDEAAAYLQHPVLGTRIRQCAELLADRRDGVADTIFGGIDAQKLRSSMTLFMRAAPDEAQFQRVLDRYFGGLPDAATDDLLCVPGPVPRRNLDPGG